MMKHTSAKIIPINRPKTLLNEEEKLFLDLLDMFDQTMALEKRILDHFSKESFSKVLSK